MSPISLSLDLLLAGLLIVTLMYGYRLSRQLKALKDSHESFAHAVGDLDRAALRAETSLSELKTNTDEAIDLLLGRIDKARDLAKQLDGLTARAEQVVEKAQAARPAAQVRSIFDRPRNPAPPLRRTSDEEAEAVAEALIMRLSEREALTSEPPAPRESAAVARARGADREQERAEARLDRRFDTLFQRSASRREPREELRLDARDEFRPAARAEAAPPARSRARVDDDLFEPQARPARLRAFDGGLS